MVTNKIKLFLAILSLSSAGLLIGDQSGQSTISDIKNTSNVRVSWKIGGWVFTNVPRGSTGVVNQMVPWDPGIIQVIVGSDRDTPINTATIKENCAGCYWRGSYTRTICVEQTLQGIQCVPVDNAKYDKNVAFYDIIINSDYTVTVKEK